MLGNPYIVVTICHTVGVHGSLTAHTVLRAKDTPAHGVRDLPPVVIISFIYFELGRKINYAGVMFSLREFLAYSCTRRTLINDERNEGCLGDGRQQWRLAAAVMAMGNVLKTPVTVMPILIMSV